MNCSTSLFDHQQRAVDKLIRSRVSGLFMDMGTGKTRTAIEFAYLRQNRIGNVVWFCPVSLMETVRYEIEKHTGEQAYVFDDDTTMRTVPDTFWYVVGIESISSSDRVTLTANSIVTPESFVIVDESSYIKGHASIRTRRITRIGSRARYRMILTGTPVSQGVVDLYAQMRFLSPKILGYNSFYSFAANHLEYSEDYPGLIVRAHNVDWLAAKIQPYVYQVTKNECLDLPRKLYDARYFQMTNEQYELYERAKWDILYKVDDYEQLETYTLFRIFTALQQVTHGFWNRNGNELIECDHYRIKVLLETVQDIPTDEQVIVWTKYHYSIRQIVASLRAAYGAENVTQFHGCVTDRESELRRFRDGARFLVATQATGGHGLTLNEANYVVFYSNEFKYSTRIQAEDRCHRIGQDRKVTYIDLVCSKSIDERIQRALEKKESVARSFRRDVDRLKDKNKDAVEEFVKSL